MEVTYRERREEETVLVAGIKPWKAIVGYLSSLLLSTVKQRFEEVPQEFQAKSEQEWGNRHEVAHYCKAQHLTATPMTEYRNGKSLNPDIIETIPFSP
jgi:hypothetical protein